MGVCEAVLTVNNYRPDVPNPTVACVMPTVDGRHVSQHQGILHRPAETHTLLSRVTEVPARDWLYTWSEGGSYAVVYDPATPYQNCMCMKAAERGDERQLARLGHRPEDHHWTRCSWCSIIIDARTEPASCSSCGFWVEKVDNFDKGWQPRSRTDRRLWRLVRVEGSDRLNAWSDGVSGAFGDRQAKVTWLDGDTRGPASCLWDNGRIPWWVDDLLPVNASVEWIGR